MTDTGDPRRHHPSQVTRRFNIAMIHYLIREQQARDRRAGPTGVEIALWRHLKARRMLGVEFRLHQRLGPFIADFWAPEIRLWVQINPPPANSRSASAWCRRHGIEHLALDGFQVLRRRGAAVQAVLRMVEARLKNECGLPLASNGI